MPYASVQATSALGRLVESHVRKLLNKFFVGSFTHVDIIGEGLLELDNLRLKVLSSCEMKGHANVHLTLAVTDWNDDMLHNRVRLQNPWGCLCTSRC